MNTTNLNDLINDLEEQEISPDPSTRTAKRRQSRKQEADKAVFVRAQEFKRDFNFTYKAARFEEAWLLNSLMDLAENEWIEDVLHKAKAGKEASVYLCKAGPMTVGAGYVAAKVYRPRTMRNLKNDAQYRAGRTDLDASGKAITKDRDLRALAKRTAHGEELRMQSWIAYEYLTMQKLFEAGADIPRPYVMANNAIVMSFVGDERQSAPALSEIRLERDEARTLFERTLRNIHILLKHEVIHGDLSAYNILYWDGEIKLIDFPQVVSPKNNPDAFEIFSRDVKRVCDYFAKQGVDSDPRRIASDLWVGYGFPEKESVPQSLIDADGMSEHE